MHDVLYLLSGLWVQDRKLVVKKKKEESTQDRRRIL